MTNLNRIKLTIFALITFICVSDVFAQNVGDKAPEIKISKWMNSAPEFKNNFKGKTVFLEFWATWCGPCRKMIPEINELVNKYKSDNMIFVSVTKEEPEKVAEFMKKNEMKAAIAIDEKGLTNANYNIKFIPHLYIINPEGKIVYAGHPSVITDEVIANYLKTGAIDTMPKPEDPEKDLLYALTVSKTKYPNEKPQYQLKQGSVQFINLDLSSILQMLFDASPMTISLDKNVLTDNLDIYYKSGTDRDFEFYKNKLGAELLNSLGLTYQKVTEKTKVYKIICRDCSKKEEAYQNLLKTATSIESDVKEINGKMNAKLIPVSMLVRTMESNFKAIFIDETKLNGYYDFTVDTKDLKTAISDLENAGFSVVESVENISMIKIKK